MYNVISKLATVQNLSLDKCNPRMPSVPIDKITIHHAAAQSTTEGILAWFKNPACGGSANYVIDGKGTIGCNVPENYRAWTSDSPDNDFRAITIELANDGGAPNWHVADKTIARCVELCVDICKRYGIKRINYTGDASGNLTRHNMFANTVCPGPYLQSMFPTIATQINVLIDRKPGDVTGDDKLDARDVTALMKAITEGTAKYLKGADVNGDGEVNARDVIALMEKLVGSTPSTEKFAVGDKVRVRVGVKTFADGTPMAEWVRAATLYVREVRGNELVVSIVKTGAVTGIIKSADAVKA